MDSAPPILPLPADAIAQIKSSIAITSLNVVIIELLKNSLDAQSSNIDVTVEYYRGNCVVEDDGLGIPPPEFKESGGLGKLHRTYPSEIVRISN
jgi:DNA mismatch repair protein MLH3